MKRVLRGWKTQVVRDWLQNNQENITVAGVHKAIAKEHGDEIRLSLVTSTFRRLAYIPGAYRVAGKRGKQKIYERVPGVNLREVRNYAAIAKGKVVIPSKKIKSQRTASHELSTLQIGRGIMAYIHDLESKLDMRLADLEATRKALKQAEHERDVAQVIKRIPRP